MFPVARPKYFHLPKSGSAGVSGISVFISGAEVALRGKVLVKFEDEAVTAGIENPI